ncbi:hypothetical protein PAPYR_3395 [Paratrimastix pyriformis]|uniref:Uncharacterized protein n=1 Tax=Paratrimastix pyriformis TaxID=342808 RepID=A0ABQ8UMG5_9EUKA|nr:hypothetical protein PAPYR_3395 [Paratrimastix pyriformis]
MFVRPGAHGPRSIAHLSPAAFADDLYLSGGKRVGPGTNATTPALLGQAYHTVVTFEAASDLQKFILVTKRLNLHEDLTNILVLYCLWANDMHENHAEAAARKAAHSKQLATALAAATGQPCKVVPLVLGARGTLAMKDALTLMDMQSKAAW